MRRPTWRRRRPRQIQAPVRRTRFCHRKRSQLEHDFPLPYRQYSLAYLFYRELRNGSSNGSSASLRPSCVWRQTLSRVASFAIFPSPIDLDGHPPVRLYRLVRTGSLGRGWRGGRSGSAGGCERVDQSSGAERREGGTGSRQLHADGRSCFGDWDSLCITHWLAAATRCVPRRRSTTRAGKTAN